MKKQVFFLCMALLFYVNSKAQITLYQSNTNFTTGIYTPVGASLTGFTLPAAGTNKVWNFSNLTASATSSFYHVTPSNINFPSATYADTSNSALFVPGWYYYYDSYTQVSANGVNTLGFTLKNQRYGITLTGNPNDSCIFLSQYCIYNSPSYVMPFPTTMSTSWNSSVRSLVKFDLTIASYGLSNAPCNKVTNTVRKDTVVGWGKMRVPTASGASIAYDVLMVKRMTVQTDSFYMNGVAAPAALLTGFGVTQGQSTTDNRFIFWRAMARYPLLMVNFGSNNFTTASSVYFDGAAQFDPSNISDINQNTDFIIYPNPNNGNFSIKLDLLENETFSLSIYNILGQTVHIQKLNSTDLNSQQISLDNLNTGTYFVSLVSENKRFTSKLLIK
ncbi:MAG: T9SS type A sorting domain-containing protein [Bacteroidales bacterium]